MQRSVIMIIVLGWIVFPVAAVVASPNEDAAEAFAAGEALLAKADFDGALQAFKRAAKATPKNQEYVQRYALLRRVVRTRKTCKSEEDPDSWLKMADALRTFYHEYRLYSEALPLDEDRHKRFGSAESAVMLAETQLAIGKNAEAGKLLGGLKEEQASPRTKVLLGLALARQGRIAEARGLAKALQETQDDLGPQYFQNLAGVHVLVGQTEKALQALTRSFELTTPSRLDTLKDAVKKCEDFAAIRDDARFAKTLKTASKIKESKCSGGAGCNKCPSRGKCGVGAAKVDGKKP